MTIPTPQSLEIFLGNGVTTSFNFTFVGDSTSYIVVTYTNTSGNATPLSPASYTVSLNAPTVGALWGIGGTVTYPLVGSPIAAGTTLTVARILPLTQVDTISNQGNFAPQVIESALDTLAMQIQQTSARSGLFRGTWATAITYNFGDYVIDGANGTNTGNYYTCVLTNISGTWSTDLAAGDWALVINTQAITSSATAAAASAAAAATSATNASTSAAAASTSAATATTQASNASTSASGASSSASSASTSASSASTSASNASTSATAAASSATTATTQASNASTSASNAATSATSAAASAAAAASALVVNSAPTNLTVSGITLTPMTAGENLVFGDICYIKSDGNIWKADANSVTLFPAQFFCTTTIASSGTGSFLITGIAKNNSWTWTAGGTIYLSTTSGAITQTAPSSTNDCIQVLGFAASATSIFFKPSVDYITHT